MINSINTKFFETHLDTYIELHPGVNVIVGESDEGKSGIVRQIKWNAENRPMGDEYRNDELDPKKKIDKLKLTEVVIDYKDSAIVARARDGFAGGVNHYQIDDGKPLRALRTDIPDEVQEVSKMKPVNIQGQHPTEQYFLLADKPGQVAKEFNKVAGLTVMDKATADINSQVRTCNTEIKLGKKEIENLQEKLDSTEWVDAAEKMANKLEAFKIKIKKKQDEYDKLYLVVYELKKIDEIMERYYGDLDAAIETISSLEKEKIQIDSKAHSIKQLTDLIYDVKNVDESIIEYKDVDKALKLLETLIKSKAKIKEEKEDIVIVETLLTKIKNNQTEITAIEIGLIDAQQAYVKLWREEECPTCGRKGI